MGVNVFLGYRMTILIIRNSKKISLVTISRYPTRAINELSPPNGTPQRRSEPYKEL